MPRNKRANRTRALVTAGATIVSVAADLASGGLGAVSGATQASLMVFDAIYNRQKSRGTRMLREAFQAEDSAFEEVIRTKLNDENVRDALLEAMRTALEALSDAVMPALGRLIREYDKNGQRADGFFRSCCRLLEDVSGEEYASLVALVQRLADARLGERKQMRVRVEDGRNEAMRAADRAPASGPFVIVDMTGYIGGRSFAVPECDPQHASRIFHLFDREGLGRRITQGRSAEVVLLEVRRDVASRLARFLL